MGRKKVALRVNRRVLVLLAVMAAPLVWGLFVLQAQENPQAAEPIAEKPSVTEPIEILVTPSPPTKPELLEKPIASVDDLRRRYPFRSLRTRLAHESKAKAMPTPKLSPAAAERLKQDDLRQEITVWSGSRRRSLETLHSAKAEQFTKQPGRGFSRMIPSESPSSLPAPTAPPVQLATAPPLVPRSGSPQSVLLSAGQDYAGPIDLPSQEKLLEFHRRGFWDFLRPARFGFVKDVDHVAGFASHKFLSEPKLNSSLPELLLEEAKDPEPWLLRRLELVSLLKHDRPVAYLSDHLPDLEQLDQYETRPLAEFETRGLEKLFDGEDLAIEPSLNVIQMIGALRASNQCLECHNVQRGTLLGAFTYELQRDPPIEGSAGTKDIVR